MAKLIIGSKTGQLCNRLFVFAHFIANAIENGYELYNPNFDEYCSYFKATSKNDFGGYPISVTDSKYERFRKLKSSNHVPLLMRISSAFLPYSILSTNEKFNLDDYNFCRLLNSKETIVAYGWRFRGYVGFKKHAKILKEFFQPIDIHQGNVNELLKYPRSAENILVGVHIRRGDYKSFAQGKYLYSDDVYMSKMLEMQQLLSRKEKEITFLLCSNEPVKNSFPGLNVLPATGHFIEDLYSLAGCDYLIGPPSTYSGWASFYGDVPLLNIADAAEKISLEKFKVHEG